MNRADLAQRNTIVGAYPIRKLERRQSHIDLDGNGKLNRVRRERDGTWVNDEPVLDVNLDQLKEFARNNSKGPVLTEECIGELTTVVGYAYGDTVYSTDETDCLSNIAKTMNPFESKFDSDQIDWAIDIQPQSCKTGATLLLFVPDNGQADC
jgi:hypothetical protein